MSDVGTIERHHVTCILGRKGTGKSDLARYLFSLFAPRRVCIDSKDEHADALPGVPTIDSPSEILQHQTVRIVPPDPTNEDWFDETYKVAFHEGDILIWNEELQTFTRPAYAPPWTKIYVYQGRQRRCGLIGTNLRPAEQHGCFLAEADHVVAYPLKYMRDLEAISRHMGYETAIDLRDDMNELEPFGFLHNDVASGDITASGPVHDPEALTAALRTLYFGPYDPR